MRNSDVIKCFLRGLDAKGSNLYSTSEKLINYNTCIAQIVNNILIINNTFYSSTTSRHQNLLKKLAEDYFKRIELTDEAINRGANDLHNYKTIPL
jgi:hypothetical protein